MTGGVLSPGIVMGLQVEQIGELPQRQERAFQVAVGPLDLPLAWGSPARSTTTRVPSRPKNAAISSCKIATPPRRSATIAVSLSHTTFSAHRRAARSTRTQRVAGRLSCGRT